MLHELADIVMDSVLRVSLGIRKSLAPRLLCGTSSCLLLGYNFPQILCLLHGSWQPQEHFQAYKCESGW